MNQQIKTSRGIVVLVIIAAFAAVMMLVAKESYQADEINSQPVNKQNKVKPSMGMANPASVNCEQKGGALEIRTDPTGGQVGYCKFSDGSECEEWKFFRGECRPANY